MSEQITEPWDLAAERVRALAAEHRSPEGITRALGLPDGFREFASVMAEHYEVREGVVALLVAMGAVLANERASS